MDKPLSPVEKFKQERAYLRIALLEYQLYAGVINEDTPIMRALRAELLRRHIAFAKQLDAYAKETDQTAEYERSLWDVLKEA